MLKKLGNFHFAFGEPLELSYSLMKCVLIHPDSPFPRQLLSTRDVDKPHVYASDWIGKPTRDTLFDHEVIRFIIERYERRVISESELFCLVQYLEHFLGIGLFLALVD
jgi:hypothetical protein